MQIAPPPTPDSSEENSFPVVQGTRRRLFRFPRPLFDPPSGGPLPFLDGVGKAFFCEWPAHAAANRLRTSGGISKKNPVVPPPPSPKCYRPLTKDSRSGRRLTSPRCRFLRAKPFRPFRGRPRTVPPAVIGTGGREDGAATNGSVSPVSAPSDLSWLV